MNTINTLGELSGDIWPGVNVTMTKLSAIEKRPISRLPRSETVRSSKAGKNSAIRMRLFLIRVGVPSTTEMTSTPWLKISD